MGTHSQVPAARRLRSRLDIEHRPFRPVTRAHRPGRLPGFELLSRPRAAAVPGTGVRPAAGARRRRRPPRPVMRPARLSVARAADCSGLPRVGDGPAQAGQGSITHTLALLISNKGRYSA